MNPGCGRAASDKKKLLNVFNKDKKLSLVKRFTTDCKRLNHSNKTDRHHRMKRLKSRKERSQMRDNWKEASTSKAHRHHLCQRAQDMAYFPNRCQSSCHCASRRNAPLANVIPTAQDPCIITDRRLIGHHGLFNHEVKSIDIERLLSEQRQSGQQVEQNSTSHPSSTSQVPSRFLAKDVLAADTDEVLPFERKSAHDDSCKEEDKINQQSDITPGQRPQQQFDPSWESFKSISSSKQSSHDAATIQSKNTKLLTTPTAVKERNVKTLSKKVDEHTVSTGKHTQNNPQSPVHQTLDPGPSMSPTRLSSSDSVGSVDSFDIQPGRQDALWASQAVTVNAVAARLCDFLQFPLLRKRNLVAENREVLLKALRETHGPQLQENLLVVQRGFSFGVDPRKKFREEELTMIDKLLPPGETTFQADVTSEPFFKTQKSTAFEMKGSRPFSWKSRPQRNPNPEQTADWLTSPMETSFSVLDDLLTPTCAPVACMDFEPSERRTSDKLFSPTSCWGETASVFQHWEYGFNKPKKNKGVMFDTFETQAVPERCSGSRYSSSDLHPPFPYQMQLPGGRSAEPMRFLQDKDPLETDRYYYTAHSTQIPHLLQSFQPWSQVSHHSTCPPSRSRLPDMTHYPPSHTLERDTATPHYFFPSPDHWSFPPMRLY
ncbi:proline-rich protein 19 isoform 1-T2 [Spinachia spinachia]